MNHQVKENLYNMCSASACIANLLHKASTTVGSIKRPKLTQEEQALQKEWKKYDDMIQQIKQAKCYLDKVKVFD